MIAYQITMTVILVLGLVRQVQTLKIQVLYGQSKKLLALFAFGILVSVSLIVWTWLLR